MRVRLTQPGFETFTGLLGVIEFREGVSVNEVARFDSLRLSAVMSCEGINGEALSLAQEIISNNQAAPIIPDRTGEDAPVQAETSTEALVGDSDTVAVVEVTSTAVVQPGELVSTTITLPQALAPAMLTQADLEAIADKGGIKALRDFADPLGIKSSSIAGLIRELIFAGHAVANPPVALE